MSSIIVSSSIFLTLSVVLSAILISNSPLFQFNNSINSSFIELPDIIPFEGNLKANDLLEHASYVGHKKIRGPETIVFSSNGSMYTGLLNGQIVRIDPDTDEIFFITQVGHETDEKICNDYGLNIHAHSSCGRPLGLRFKPDNSNFLYFTDAYLGLFKLDLIQGTKKLLLSPTDPRFNDKPPKMLNDLDISGDLIYFIDSSFVRVVNEAIDETLEGQSRGRLFSYNEQTDELKLLTDDLYFPNGLQLMPDGNEILINECSRSRILRYYLNGDKAGSKDVFANIPGLGDTIRLTDHGSLLVPIALARRSKYSNIMDLLGKYPLIRNFLGTFVNVRAIMMNYKVLPKYGLLVEYDLNGNILRSWHDTTGKTVGSTSNAAFHKNKLYIGSYYSDFIAVVDY